MFCFCAGLARKEDYQYITYYCPHCHALNKSNQLESGARTDRSAGGTGNSSNQAARPEVFSTLVASVRPPVQDAVSNSGKAGSSALTSVGEPIFELDSDNSLSDS